MEQNPYLRPYLVLMSTTGDDLHTVKVNASNVQGAAYHAELQLPEGFVVEVWPIDEPATI